MSVEPAELVTWFKDRYVWIQRAAKQLAENGSLTAADDAELLKLCKEQAVNLPKKGKTATGYDLSASALKLHSTTATVRLISVSEPKGIDHLTPKRPLEFGSESLAVVYGRTGSGKSGYIRILKKMCGARSARDLFGNAFSTTPTPQSCKIAYALAGISKEITWTPTSGVLPDLSSVEVYDSDCARVYTNEENQVLYAPPVLTLFDGLIAACGRIEEALKAEILALPSKKPIAPLETIGTKAAEWYSRLSAATTKSEIDSCCVWDETTEKDLTDARRRLAESNPADLAKRLRDQAKIVGELAARLSGYHTDFADEVLNKIEVARTDAAVKRKAADADAEKVFENAPLEGVGTESWKLLWEAARDYATAKAYPEEKFPNVGSEALCVLCQQELGAEAKGRLSSFELYVKGSLETAAKAAEQRVSDLLNGLPKLDTAEAFDLRLAALKVEDESVLNDIRQHHGALRDHLDAVIKSTPTVALPGKAVITKLSEIASGIETQAETIDKDDQKDVRKELASKEKELAAQKWLSEQKKAILAEYDRLGQVRQLEEAKKLTRTNQLSEKKGVLTEEMITQEFIKRFNAELKVLSASRLQVEIVQTKTTKGQVWCQLRLKGASIKCKAGDVLSEGEQRIVSLAAFLADCEGSGSNSTFIFDDPISSLDQDYEEATVRRLVELSKKRQVIVFTHRISLLTLIQEEAKAEKQKLNLVGLKRESWGTGEPGDCPCSITKPGAVLNFLLSDRLAKAKKAFTNDGIDAYNPLGKALCGDIRNTVEALIEFTLIDGVVLRFRRGVQTKQIHSLARVTAADCKLVEDFITKYSCFEHSQPVDLPVTIPEPDEIEADLKKLIEWHKEFTSRT